MFDLYFAGSYNTIPEETIRKYNLCRLFSQLNDRKNIEGYVDYLRNHKDCTCKLFIDSGSFTAFTKGKVVDVDDYISYINSIDDVVTVFVQVDKITGPNDTADVINEGSKYNWDNYLYMSEKVKSRDKLLPVFHQNEDFKWLDNMLEYKREDGTSIPYICLSTINGASTSEKITWLRKCFNHIKNSTNKDVKTHALGMTIRKVLEMFPITSADSTGWLLSAAMGGVYVGKYNEVVSVSPKSVHKNTYVDFMPQYYRQEIDRYLKELNLTFEDIQDNPGYRMRVNVLNSYEWAKDYKCEYKEDLNTRKSLW